MKITKELRLWIAGLSGLTACSAGEATGELTISRSDEAALAGRYGGDEGPRLDFEVVAGERGPTARVLGDAEGALLRVERDEAGAPVVWVGGVPIAEAADDAAPAELTRVFETDEWAAMPGLVDAVEGADAPAALVRTLREGLDLATGAVFDAPDLDPPTTQGYSSLMYIYGCLSWYQARSIANSRCSSYGYSYANWVASWAWTACGYDSGGNRLYRTHEYQCYRGSSW